VIKFVVVDVFAGFSLVLLLLTIIGNDFTWVTLVVLKGEYRKHLLSEKLFTSS